MKIGNLNNWKQNKALTDIIVIVVVLFLFLFIFDIFEPFWVYLAKILKNKIILILEYNAIFFLIALSAIFFAIRRWYELKQEKIKRKDSEKRMYKSRAELQAVLDGVPDMIMQVDSNLRILWANRAALQRSPNAIGKMTRDAFPVTGESVFEIYTKWAMVTGIIEKGIKYQPNLFGEEGGSYWEGIGIPLKSNDNVIYGAIAIVRNVTERMRLEHTSNLLASIVESTDDAIYGMSYDSTIISWNLGAEKIYGFDSSEIIGRTGIQTVLPEERPLFLQHVENVIRTQEISRFELTRTRKDNQEIFVSITLCPFVDATGRKIGVSAIDRDITQRRKAEKALIESEARYRELFENMSSGVAVFEVINRGKDFIFKDFNRGAEIIENLTKDKLIGRRCSIVFQELKIDGLLEILKSVYQTNQYRQDLITIKEDSKIVGWRDYRVYYLPSGELVAIYDDITERIQAEDALKESEEKFRTLVSTAPDGIVLTDTERKIIEVNTAFAEIFGDNRIDILGKSFEDFFGSSESKNRAMKILNEETIENDILQKEIMTISQTGEIVYIELSVAHLKDEYGDLTGMIAITRDISLRKMYESELKDSREQLRSLAIHLQTAREEERKNIAFEIHDELGYALTALKLDLAWMVKKMNLKDNNMLVKTRSMAELIDTTINKVRSISTQLRPSILDHFGLIAAIEWQANEFQKRTGIRTKLEIEPKDLQFKDPYSTAIFRIFQETLTNITRHAKASRVDVSFKTTDDFIELRISDNGIGLKPEQLLHSKSLGLIGIRERAFSIGGEVGFISENGEGTTVVLKVPVKETLKEQEL
jgi:PAS domain S-box-containing protein